jgi:hypothetical protein
LPIFSLFFRRGLDFSCFGKIAAQAIFRGRGYDAGRIS